jgi:malate/lactate dehydrogenase
VNAIRAAAGKSKDLIAIEGHVEAYCAKPPTEKEVKLCYYIAPIKRELSQPIKNGVPSEKICERLKKSSAEICSLRFATTVLPPAAAIEDFAKLRMKDLKQIMAEKKLACSDCLEKDDFVKFLEERKAKGEL